MKILQKFTAVALCASAVVISGCGSEEKPQFTSLVVFGSSLSDVGSYQAGAIAAIGGGRNTINPGKIWVESLADKANVGIKPGIVGFATQVAVCPQAPCTGWAQGGARITNPAGTGKSQGLLTVPVVQQMDLQLAQKSAYTPGDLVIVASGPNDVYIQGEALAAATTALIGTGLSPAAAQTQALANGAAAVVQAGNELVDAIDKKIIAKGASYVVVIASDDILGTPTAASIGPANTAVISGWIKLFNETVAAGIKAKNLALVSIDMNALTKDVLANPANYGMTNTTTTACDPAKIAVASGGLNTTGSSLLCTANTLRTGADADTWMYADTSHYASRMHKIISDYVVSQLAAKGWF
jgi:outer membrane lipase/esterase